MKVASGVYILLLTFFVAEGCSNANDCTRCTKDAFFHSSGNDTCGWCEGGLFHGCGSTPEECEDSGGQWITSMYECPESQCWLSYFSSDWTACSDERGLSIILAYLLIPVSIFVTLMSGRSRPRNPRWAGSNYTYCDCGYRFPDTLEKSMSGEQIQLTELTSEDEDMMDFKRVAQCRACKIHSKAFLVIYFSNFTAIFAILSALTVFSPYYVTLAAVALTIILVSVSLFLLRRARSMRNELDDGLVDSHHTTLPIALSLSPSEHAYVSSLLEPSEKIEWSECHTATFPYFVVGLLLFAMAWMAFLLPVIMLLIDDDDDNWDMVRFMLSLESFFPGIFLFVIFAPWPLWIRYIFRKDIVIITDKRVLEVTCSSIPKYYWCSSQKNIIGHPNTELSVSFASFSSLPYEQAEVAAGDMKLDWGALPSRSIGAGSISLSSNGMSERIQVNDAKDAMVYILSKNIGSLVHLYAVKPYHQVRKVRIVVSIVLSLLLLAYCIAIPLCLLFQVYMVVFILYFSLILFLFFGSTAAIAAILPPEYRAKYQSQQGDSV